MQFLVPLQSPAPGQTNIIDEIKTGVLAHDVGFLGHHVETGPDVNIEMQEEARHILFFVNWVAWHRRNLPRWRRPWFWAKIVAVWIYLIRERIGLARGFDSNGADPTQVNNFAFTASKTVSDIDLSAAALIDICLEENQRRLAGYDARLLRPQVVPRLARLIRRFLRAPKLPTAAAP